MLKAEGLSPDHVTRTDRHAMSQAHGTGKLIAAYQLVAWQHCQGDHDVAGAPPPPTYLGSVPYTSVLYICTTN